MAEKDTPSNIGSLSTIRRYFGSIWRSRSCARELGRLHEWDSAVAPVLSDVFKQWRSREPIDDPLIPKIEQQRDEWLHLTAPPRNIDPVIDDMSVFLRACRASKGPIWAELLYRIVGETRPAVVLELGTNIGISSAYLAAAGEMHSTRVITLERDPARIALACWLHDKLGLRNVSYAPGPFIKSLPTVLDEAPVIDFAFIDGHHLLESTLEYFELIHSRLRDYGIVVFDDITWSEGMIELWQRLQADDRFSFLVDLGEVGIGVTRTDSVGRPPEVFHLHAPGMISNP